MRTLSLIGIAVLALALVGFLLLPKYPPAAGDVPEKPALVATPGRSTESKAGGGGSRTSDENGVTLKVTWQGPQDGPVFAVVMDTHSVALDGYDLRELATLRTDQGVVAQPTSWDAPKGGHHRQGTLTFPATTQDGAPLIGPSTKSLELTVRGVAGVPERKLQWELPS